jgi:transposase
MPKDQRTFTKEFKLEAVQVAHTSGKSQAHIARDLGLAESTFHHWCTEFAQAGSAAFPGRGNPPAEVEEMRR